MKFVAVFVFFATVLAVYSQRTTPRIPTRSTPRQNGTNPQQQCGQNEMYFRGCGPCEKRCFPGPIRPPLPIGPGPVVLSNNGGRPSPMPINPGGPMIPNNNNGGIRPGQGPTPQIQPGNGNNGQGQIFPPIGGGQMCTAVCQPEGCYCKRGFYRNEQNECVLPFQCQRNNGIYPMNGNGNGNGINNGNGNPNQGFFGPNGVNQ